MPARFKLIAEVRNTGRYLTWERAPWELGEWLLMNGGRSLVDLCRDECVVEQRFPRVASVPIDTGGGNSSNQSNTVSADGPQGPIEAGFLMPTDDRTLVLMGTAQELRVELAKLRDDVRRRHRVELAGFLTSLYRFSGDDPSWNVFAARCKVRSPDFPKLRSAEMDARQDVTVNIVILAPFDGDYQHSGEWNWDYHSAWTRISPEIRFSTMGTRELEGVLRNNATVPLSAPQQVRSVPGEPDPWRKDPAQFQRWGKDGRWEYLGNKAIDGPFRTFQQDCKQLGLADGRGVMRRRPGQLPTPPTSDDEFESDGDRWDDVEDPMGLDEND